MVLPSAETGLDYDGPFSTHPEWHAFILGIHAGLDGEGDIVLAIVLGDQEAKTEAGREIQAEPWYASGGVLTARAFQRVR